MTDVKPWKLPSLTVVPQALVPCTVYKAGFLASYTPLYIFFFFANSTLQYSSSSTNSISKLWETTGIDRFMISLLLREPASQGV